MNFTPVASTQFVEGFCIIKSVEKKITAKGSPYLDMILEDKSGEIVAKFWNYEESPDFTFQRYDFVKVRGQESPFNDTIQFRIDKIRKVVPGDNVIIDDYVPSACLPGEVMFEEIQNIVFDFRDEELKKLVMVILEKYKEKLIYWPAAKALHHAIRGGLLMHTLSILRLASSVYTIYSYINYDLLCAGIILHDIAKIWEIDASEIGTPGDYSVQGNLVGHLVMGAIEIDRVGREIGTSDDTLMLLEHMLISHHGVPEYGAAKYPMIIEAQVLSMLDDFDAKMFEFSNSVFNVEPGEFTSKQWALDNRILYNHGRSELGDVTLI